MPVVWLHPLLCSLLGPALPLPAQGSEPVLAAGDPLCCAYSHLPPAVQPWPVLLRSPDCPGMDSSPTLCLRVCLEPGLSVLLDAFEAGVGALALSLPGAMQALGIHGKLSPHSCLWELMASWLRGWKGPAFPGRGGSPVARRDQARVYDPQDLSSNTVTQRQDLWRLREFLHLWKHGCLSGHGTWMPGSQLSLGSHSQASFSGVGSSVFSTPSGSIHASHPLVSQMIADGECISLASALLVAWCWRRL